MQESYTTSLHFIYLLPTNENNDIIFSLYANRLSAINLRGGVKAILLGGVQDNILPTKGRG